MGIGKRPEKIPVWWEISLSGRKKVFHCMDHLVLHGSFSKRAGKGFFKIIVRQRKGTFFGKEVLRKMCEKYCQGLVM
jgi:hypothetical protein